jgi:uncharacterized RDD family membrane protein YckC
VLLRGSYYCADCKTEQVRDVQSGTDATVLDYGSVGRRFGAIFIDGLVQTVASYALVIPLGMAMGTMDALDPGQEPGDISGLMIVFLLVMYGIMFAIPVAYEALMLQSRGQTLGKMALGLKVVTPDGNDISGGQAWGRAGMRLVLNFCLLIDYIPALFNKEKTCIHDMVAKTRVVRIQS